MLAYGCPPESGIYWIKKRGCSLLVKSRHILSMKPHFIRKYRIVDPPKIGQLCSDLGNSAPVVVFICWVSTLKKGLS